MTTPPPFRPPASRDPNLTVLPHISAPVDEGLLIPYPPRSRWTVLLWAVALGGGAAAALVFAFLRGTALP